MSAGGISPVLYVCPVTDNRPTPLPMALSQLEAEVTGCRRCPRLVAWREQVARERRAAFRQERYWGRPLPGFGDPDARIVLLGLAPAAHGGNRTGRIFTGDRSGDFLFASLWRVGLANIPTSVARDDGLRLTGVWVTAAVRCAPPANRPSGQERDNCLPWTLRELDLLKAARVVVCLGGFAWEAALRIRAAMQDASKVNGAAEGAAAPAPRGKREDGEREHAAAAKGIRSPAHAGRPVARRSAFASGVRPPFAHGAVFEGGRLTLLGCYHPSQQNTFTGRLTEQMIDAVMMKARELAGLS